MCIRDRGNPVTAKQELFLANPATKSRFIELLCRKFNERQIRTSVADDNADVLIVETAIQWHRKNHKRTVIVGEDIDFLVILIGLSNPADQVIFLKRSRGTVQKRLYDISKLTATTPELKLNITFAHAFTGCDSTSTTYNKGKVRF